MSATAVHPVGDQERFYACAVVDFDNMASDGAFYIADMLVTPGVASTLAVEVDVQDLGLQFAVHSFTNSGASGSLLIPYDTVYCDPDSGQLNQDLVVQHIAEWLQAYDEIERFAAAIRSGLRD